MKAGNMVFAALLFSFLFISTASASVDGPVAARELVLDTVLQGSTEGRMLMVHPDLLPAGTEITTWHEVALKTPTEGYVVFIDDMALANFEHPCRYVFVDRKTGDTSVTQATTPPVGLLDWLNMETESYRAMKNAKNVRALRSPRRGGPPMTPRGGEFYAVLMSGGASTGNNHVRYWNDLSNIYITLVDVYGYKDQNIIVLCSDGLDPAVDQSNGLNSHPDLDGDGDDDIMYSCVKSNIQLVFGQLSTILTSSDQLFVFTTDHGGTNGGWNTYENLWNFEELADSELETMYAALPACDIITTMEQCYSGGFLDNLSQNQMNRVFSSACRYDELSWAMPPNYEYDTYVFYWTAAVKGEDAYGVPCDADYNQDGLVSMHEAFLYAEANDISAETPQYNSNPALLGDDLCLGPGPNLSLRILGGRPDGFASPGLEHTISLEIKAGTENYVPGSGYLHYRFASGAAWTDEPFVPLGGDFFEVTLPATRPGDEPEYYFSCQGSLGSTVLSPADAPASVYSFDVCLVETVFSDDFENDLNWTVIDNNVQSGTWVRCVPNTTTGGQVAPVEDNPAGTGTYCYVTDNGPPGGSYSDYDVDGGPTLLISDAIDLSGGDALVSCYLWFYGRDGDDPFNVDVSNNNGQSWTNVSSTNVSLNGWTPFSFKVGDYVAPTSFVKVRFSAQDQPNNSIVEAGVDDFRVERLNFTPSIWADGYSFSAPAGCQIAFLLDAGAGYAGRAYAVGAGLSGSVPGTPLPGGEVFPVNWDWLTDFMIANPSSPVFPNSRGSLDGQGRMTSGLVLAGPGATAFVGQTLTFAFALTGSFDFVSNPVFIEIEP
jgi:hypothetical protein